MYRVPLHFKVMVSYLVVVGLVLLPTLVYLRTLFRQSLIEATEKRMGEEAAALAARLGSVDEASLPLVMASMLADRPHRVTIVDPSGRVLADSLGDPAGPGASPGSRVYGSHASRPEIVQALATGAGSSVRTSSTTDNERVYVARRFPPTGPPRGVVRLSVPTHDLDDVLERSYRFTEKAGALALSAAFVLSLVAALVVSRPLRRLTEAIRAYEQGDLGHDVAVDSADELGELADALRALARSLSGKLREAGGHKATFEMLIEEAPVGVIVYDDALRPLIVNARARELCRFGLTEDLARAAELAQTPEHATAIAEARAEQKVVVTAMPAPVGGRRGSSVDTRWMSVPGHPDDGRVLCLLTDAADRERVANLEALVRLGGKLLRQAAAGTGDVALAARLEAAADEADRAVLGRRAAPEQVEGRAVGALCQAVLEDVRARAAARGIRVTLELDDPALQMVEAEGRSQQALRRLLDAMISEAPPHAEVRLSSEASAKHVRITARALDTRRIKTKPIAELIHCLGGDAGSKHTGDASEAWLKIPRG